MLKYTNCGPVDCDVDFDTSSIKGKTAIVTGGASGIGEGYTRALVKAGCYVLIADIDAEQGSILSSELLGLTKFVRCDVTSWEDQLAAFKEAVSFSPSGRVDIVIPNAGIDMVDPMYVNNVELEEPEKPEFKILDVNMRGAFYTIKITLHYFRRQNALHRGSPLDQLLILVGSMAAYLELEGSIQYTASKAGLRGILRSLRASEWKHNIRVNYLAPWFLKTKILSDAAYEELQKNEVEFASFEDAGSLVLRIASDPTVNGRAFAILPRSKAPRGYADLDVDDYPNGALLQQLQDKANGALGRSRDPAL
ncbi:glucose 1-dehydrogenase [Ilyonectria sp. MPI-CAGE-AT-0026]|nr:glucose 1-dehydrogenase [Ilyonectria sp. MPI-CAGE-AT-0026]